MIGRLERQKLSREPWIRLDKSRRTAFSPFSFPLSPPISFLFRQFCFILGFPYLLQLFSSFSFEASFSHLVLGIELKYGVVKQRTQRL